MQTERVFRVLLAVFGQCNQSFVQLGGKLSYACLVSIFIALFFSLFSIVSFPFLFAILLSTPVVLCRFVMFRRVCHDLGEGIKFSLYF